MASRITSRLLSSLSTRIEQTPRCLLATTRYPNALPQQSIVARHVRPFSSSNSRSNGYRKEPNTWALASAVTAAAVGFGIWYAKTRPIHAEAAKKAEDVVGPEPLPAGTSYFRLADIKKHNSSSEEGKTVYDITEFVQSHPGGSVILRAAGGALEPYWSVFSFHTRPDILDILEEFRIGEVDPRDLVNGKVPADAIEDPFKDDPERDPRLMQLTTKPCNAETPGECLQTFITPSETFFTRNHLWVPQVKPSDWELKIELPDGTEKSYTMAELQSLFKQYTITATLQCSGNRRSHMTANSRASGFASFQTGLAGKIVVDPPQPPSDLDTSTANGLQWDVGAISNAEWTGVKLRDVLKHAGLTVDDLPEYARHVQFFGGEGYGASIPIQKACDPSGDVLLATSMNGKPLPPDHGAPVRALVPGTVAARSVKWLNRISVAEEESTSQWQRRDYKCFGPNVGSNPNWEKALSIQELPVQSAITSIEEFWTQTEDERALLRNYGLEEDFIKIAGYAYSGGGRAIQRVDISVDGGVTWRQAKLEPSPSKGSKTWSWTTWTHMVPKGYVGREIVVKAVDDSYNTQPDSYEANWNFRGNLTTSWHRVPRPNFKS